MTIIILLYLFFLDYLIVMFLLQADVGDTAIKIFKNNQAIPPTLERQV